MYLLNTIDHSSTKMPASALLPIASQARHHSCLHVIYTLCTPSKTHAPPCAHSFAAVVCSHCHPPQIRSYNRKRDGKRTPLFRDMTTKQYIGCVLVVIGLLPYIGYLFQGICLAIIITTDKMLGLSHTGKMGMRFSCLRYYTFTPFTSHTCFNG